MDEPDKEGLPTNAGLLNSLPPRAAELTDQAVAAAALANVQVREARDATMSSTPITEEQLPIPNLQISREQTPESEYDGSEYADLARASPEPEEPEDEPRGTKRSTPSLVKEHAVVKRVRRDDDDVYDPANPTGARKEVFKKRVSGKAIEKLWIPLEAKAFRSFENMCGISMKKVLERFEGVSRKDAKIAEAQRVLTQHWISGVSTKSFLARLNVTKLPPLKSLQVRMRGAKSDNFDPLSIDEVRHRKAVFETYLLAEIKQLDGLERYYNSLKNMYELDSKYLGEFKKNTSTLVNQIAQERDEQLKLLHFDTTAPQPDADINLATQVSSVPGLSTKARFDPNEDDAVKQVLEQLDNDIKQLALPTESLLNMCDQLDTVQKMLYDRTRAQR